MPSIAVLPIFGAVGGAIAGYLIKNIAPAAKGSGVSQIMGFLRHKKVPMNLKVGLVKLISGIIAIGSGFPLGPEVHRFRWEDQLLGKWPNGSKLLQPSEE